MTEFYYSDFLGPILVVMLVSVTLTVLFIKVFLFSGSEKKLFSKKWIISFLGVFVTAALLFSFGLTKNFVDNVEKIGTGVDDVIIIKEW